ncbi:MAG: acyltransferase [Oscillospiraceae bacterium]|nr:acyltransferase [Oscillospiraceae bacterium]
MKQRVDWLDVVKCFGIFAIYWCHYGVDGGHAYLAVIQYSVPLFFFASGCLENFSKQESILVGIGKIIRGILVPWLFYCVISVITHILETDCELLSLWVMIWKILAGTPKNEFVAWGLWFLTCMAVVKLIFLVLRRLNNKLLILSTCAVIFCAASYAVDLSEPKLPFNADIALHYLWYFAVGYVAYPWIDRFLQTRKRTLRLLLAGSFCFSAMYSAYFYFGRNLFEGRLPGEFLQNTLYPFASMMVLIWFQIVLAYIFRDVVSFQKLGRNTLHLCGSEYLVRTFLNTVAGIVQIDARPHSSLASLFFTLITLWWVNRYLVPVEKRILSEIQKVPDYLMSKS